MDTRGRNTWHTQQNPDSISVCANTGVILFYYIWNKIINCIYFFVRLKSSKSNLDPCYTLLNKILKGLLHPKMKMLSLITYPMSFHVFRRQWTVCKTRPPLVTVATTDKQCRSHTTHMFSRSEKYITEQRGNWQHTDREDRAGYFWYEARSHDPQLFVIFKEIQTINTVLWLFKCVVTTDL